MKKIIKAAIKHKGKIYTGLRHGLIMENMRNKGVTAYITQEEQGFLTSSGKFVSRVEAAKIAFKAGQIKEYVYSLDSYQVFPLI